MPGEGSSVPDMMRMLNESFYAKSPARYFHGQALQLLRIGDELADDRSDSPPGNFTDEVVRRMPGWHSGIEERGDDWQSRRRDLLAIESFMLAHHAGEALLRAFIAHVHASAASAVPWLAIAELRSPATFRAVLDEIVAPSQTAALSERVSRAFLPELEQVELDPTLVDETVEFICAWIRHFAAYYLETATTYHAAKHGLGSLAGQATLSVHDVAADGAPTDGGIVVLSGDILESLGSVSKAPGVREWSRTTRAIDLPGLVATALIAAHLLDELWKVGRAIHLTVPVELHLISSPMPRDVKAIDPRAWGTSFRFGLFTETTGPSENVGKAG